MAQMSHDEMVWPIGPSNFTDLTSAPGFEYLSNQLILNQGGKRAWLVSEAPTAIV
jgi:hypothetical protein